MRAVIDTNVVISALVFGGRLAWLRDAWRRRQVTPVVCRETAAELLRVLHYPKFKLTGAERELLLADFLPFAEVVRLPDHPPALPVACRDRSDAVFLQLAMAACADCLVSGDADVTVMRTLVAVPIVTVLALRTMVDPVGTESGT